MTFDRWITIASHNNNPTIVRLQSLLPSEVKREAFDARNGLVLRWGTSYRIKNAKRILNSATAIRRTRKKLKMLDLLREAGVIVPKEIDSVPCVARWDGGSRGSGIRFCRYEEEVKEAKAQGAGALLEWIAIKKEYRIHVFRGLVISVSEKMWTDWADENIRSASHGWEFSEDIELHMTDAIDLISSALSAVRALKLDFGAVDIAMSEDNIPVVFEVNTAPGLNDKRATIYVKAINKWLDTFQ